jgi:hypothetical protein
MSLVQQACAALGPVIGVRSVNQGVDVESLLPSLRMTSPSASWHPCKIRKPDRLAHSDPSDVPGAKTGRESSLELLKSNELCVYFRPQAGSARTSFVLEDCMFWKQHI